MELYEHQKKALTLVRERTHGILLMTCGSGKSAIYQESAKKVATTLVMVPRKILVDQLYDDYFKNMKNANVFKLNSDHRGQMISSTKRKRRKLTEKQQNAMKEQQFATLMDEASPQCPFIVLANYQSVNRLSDLLSGRVFDQAFFDEGHNVYFKVDERREDDEGPSELGTDDEEDEEDSDLEEDEEEDDDGGDGDASFRARQLLSKTQKAPHVARKSVDNQDHLQKLRGFGGLNGFPARKYFFCTATATDFMLNNPEIYGPVLIEFSYNEAVKSNIVKKFNLHVECLRVRDDCPDAAPPFLWSIGQFIIHQDLRRVIVYTNRIKDNSRYESLRTSMALETFREQEKLNHLPRCIRVDYITHQTTIDQRQRIFRQFRNTVDTTFRMIVSCRTISEGVDLTSADGIILLDSRSNNITTTQRILRCTRLTREERKQGHWEQASVLIPLMHQTVSSFQKDVELNTWLERFVASLDCSSRYLTRDNQNDTVPTNTADGNVIIPIHVGDNIDTIPYDPLECTRDPMRTRFRKLLSHLNNMTDVMIDDIERGVFHYVLDLSKVKHFSRNWDDPRFSEAYKLRSILLNASFKRDATLLQKDLYTVARKWSPAQLRPEIYSTSTINVPVKLKSIL